jgi:hypothetical protein
MKQAVILSFLTLCGCSSLNLTMKSPMQFRQLKDVPIRISTKKEVKLVGLNQDTLKMVMDGYYSDKYMSSGDSLILFFPTFTASMPFSDISKIKCSGMWDTEIGFISEKELMRFDYKKGHNRRFGTSIASGLVGFLCGGCLFVKATDHTALEHSDDWYSYVFVSALGGALGGATICNKLIQSSDRRKIIEKIKEERIKGNLQK